MSLARNHDLWETVADALGVDKVTVLSTDEDIRAAEREQWDDGTNYLAVAPGVIAGYERNVATNTMLRKHGIEVVTIAGSEDASGRFVWPGFGENIRVLKWIIERLSGRAKAVATPIGYLPAPGSLDLDGLEISWADLALLLTVDTEAWKLEAEHIPEHFQTFHRHLPARLRELHEELTERLG